MSQPKLSNLELQIMNVFWSTKGCSIREVQESFPERGRPAYSTIQTTVYRLEAKKAVRRARRIGNADIFEAVISQDHVQGRLIDDLLSLLGGRFQPIMAHLIESGRFTMNDVKEAEKTLREMQKKK